MLTPEEKQQFNDIFNELSKSLDISKTRYEAAVKSYEFVGEWLSKPESALARYKPEIRPQGSFLFGTMIEPVEDSDHLDVDLVCQLTGKNASWTQYDLKKIVGDRLRDHAKLKEMLDEEGRRCWTLLYRDSARFHMDILPAIISEDYFTILEKAMAARDTEDWGQTAIHITDKFTLNYTTSNDPLQWLKSNPFGYAAWFKLRASVNLRKAMTVNEAIQPVPDDAEKLPLQRVVQILKRHRDIMFKGDDKKPISIIITTLSAKAYGGEPDVLDALLKVVKNMESYIEVRHFGSRSVKWVSNPVNAAENFADKWQEDVVKEANFYRWLRQVKQDVADVIAQRNMYRIQESMAKPFGDRAVTKTFSQLGEKAKAQRDLGIMKMAAGTGILGSTGRTTVGYHNNFGNGN
jgi:hypothetical protein